MSAEIIAIGSELTCGARLDTNSQWLSRELESLGWTVTRHTTLADHREQIIHELRAAAGRAQVVIITGGLGPTLDDLTRECLADAFQQPLVHDTGCETAIRALFAARGRTMPERNLRQATRPASAVVLPNSCGTAPGLLMRVPQCLVSPVAGENEQTTSPLSPVHGGDGQGEGGAATFNIPLCLFAALPGVPAEMQPMFRDQVVPQLPASGVVIRRRTLRTFGLGESDVEQRLGDLTARNRNPEVGITASEAVISLLVTARAPSDDEAQALCDSTCQTIRTTLGSLVYGEEDTDLVDVVCDLLTAGGQRIAVLEGSATGGLLAQWLTETPQRSAILASSSIDPDLTPTRWSPDVLIRLRDVIREAQELRQRVGAVAVLLSSPRRFETTSTGVAVCHGAVTLVTAEHVEDADVTMTGNLAIFRPRAARTVLNLLRLWLLNPASRRTAGG
jgi:nicotinamide-nucleotide amidase